MSSVEMEGLLWGAKMVQHLKSVAAKPKYDPWDHEVEEETPSSCPDLHTHKLVSPPSPVPINNPVVCFLGVSQLGALDMGTQFCIVFRRCLWSSL